MHSICDHSQESEEADLVAVIRGGAQGEETLIQ